MNDDLRAKLLDYMSGLEEAAKAGKDFVIANAPETVRQYLAWHFWYSTLLGVFLLALSVAIALTYKAWWRHCGTFSNEMDKHGARACPGIVAASAFAASTGFAISNILVAVKVTIAPNVFLIETIAGLVKR